MMSNNEKNDLIGYGKPPTPNRFQKGHSGNPKGRRVGPLNIQEAMHKALRSTVNVTEGGERKRMSMAEVVVTRLANRVTSGDARAIVTAIAILRQGRQAALEGPIEITLTETEMRL